MPDRIEPTLLQPLVRRVAVLCGASLLGACAHFSGSAPTSAPSPSVFGQTGVQPGVAAPGHATPRPAPAATAATAPSMPSASGSLPPFAVVVRDARRIDGPLTLWQRDDRVWIELRPEQFDEPMLLSPKIKSGISEAWVLGGLMSYPINGAGGPQIVEFVRVHNQVRLQARNTDVVATRGTPEALAVAASYSHSLLGSVPVASQPHPERKSVLIEANGLFLGDMQGIAMKLQRGLRQGYSLDGRNSAITAVRGSADAIVIETQNHYYTASVGVPSGPPSGSPAPALPRYLPDSRSLLVGLHYSLAKLPDRPMPSRTADPRIGTFTTTVLDFSNDLPASPRRRLVNRWRLEKADPAAAVSEPVKPVTFWIDRNVPLAYRDTVRAAILEWNKPFEKIGFRDAIVVRQQPDDAEFDTLDFGYASVRWMMNANPVFGAIGPSHVDPRSGEILDADIGFEGMSARSVRGVRNHVLGAGGAARAPAAVDFGAGLGGHGPGDGHEHDAHCQHGAMAAEQLGYAMDVMEARGDLDPDSPQARQFVLDYIKEVIMHEVGHTLGLRHNFRASRAYTDAQLSDAAFTREHGTTASVMDYNAVNLPSPGQTGGAPFQSTLGPYDYWAVEYAYSPLPPGADAQAEASALRAIAERSSEPLLAFGTDEDHSAGIDPESIQMDLGADPIAFAAKRLDIARDLFRRQETRQLSPHADYAVLRRSLGYAIADVTRAVGVLMRQIGGVRTLRDYPGSGRDPLQPVDAAVQRRALALIASSVLAADGLTLSPSLQRRLAPDYLDRAELMLATEFAVPQRLLELQRGVLNHLMGDTVAARILDSVGKYDRPTQAFQLAELHTRLMNDVWSELDTVSTISPARRELQREYVNRVAASLLRPSTQTRADARGLVRVQARELLARLQKPGRKAADAQSRSHLDDVAETLRLALTAQAQRPGI